MIENVEFVVGVREMDTEMEEVADVLALADMLADAVTLTDDDIEELAVIDLVGNALIVTDAVGLIEADVLEDAV